MSQDKPAVAVVPIAAEHVEGVWEALDAVAREGRYLASERAPPIEASRAFVANNIEQGYPHFVAIAGDLVVGWCDVVGTRRQSRIHCGTLGMGLLPDWRGQGIGRRLIDAAVAAAWRRGFKRIELTVYASNAAALRLYGSVGFVEEGRLRAAAYIDDAFVDVIPMALLAPAMLGEGPAPKG